MQSIHCKVSACGSLRRFVLTEAKYSTLQQQIVAVFGLESNDIVVKYKDEENTLVTISSDEELSFAVQLMGTLLRLVVDQPKSIVKESEDSHPGKDIKFENKERALAVLTRKHANLSDRLAALKASENAKQQARIPKLEQKLSIISENMAKLSETPQPSETSTTTALVLKTPETSFDHKLMKEAKFKCVQLQKEFEKERKKIQALTSVVSALKVLARNGVKANSPVQVDMEQALIAKSALVASKNQLAEKKQLLREQTILLKLMKKQHHDFVRTKKSGRKAPVRPEKPMKHRRVHKTEQAVNQEKESRKQEIMTAKQAKRDQWQAEKAKRKEERAAHVAQAREERAAKRKERKGAKEISDVPVAADQ